MSLLTSDPSPPKPGSRVARVLAWIRGVPSAPFADRGAPGSASKPATGVHETTLEVRTRFWKAVREGQAEAESRSAGGGR